MVGLPLLLAVASAPTVPPEAPPEPGAFTWCMSEGTGPAGRTRYVSDPFETDIDSGDAIAFQEYVDQSYLHRRDGGFHTVCTRFPSRQAAETSLAKARGESAGAKVVTTAWRARFE